MNGIMSVSHGKVLMVPCKRTRMVFLNTAQLDISREKPLTHTACGLLDKTKIDIMEAFSAKMCLKALSMTSMCGTES